MEEKSYTKEEVIDITINLLGQINVPVDLAQQIAIPISNAQNNLCVVLKMIEKEHELEEKKRNEQEEKTDE
jgi:hypothetical protein